MDINGHWNFVLFHYAYTVERSNFLGFSPYTVKKKNDNCQGSSRAVLGWAVPNFFCSVIIILASPHSTRHAAY